MLQQARPNRLKVTALAYLQVHLMCISPINKCQTSTDSTSTRISQSQQQTTIVLQVKAYQVTFPFRNVTNITKNVS